MKNKFTKLAAALTFVALSPSLLAADTYKVDYEGMHAFIQFRVKHLGYSWLYGRFDDFGGSFEFDSAENTLNNVDITIDTESLDTNHAERDKHIRSSDFLNTSEHPTASFVLSNALDLDDNSQMTGELTMYGTTKEVTFDIEHIGGGDDPWGGHRQGFQAEATIQPADFGLDLTKKLGAAAATVDLIISIEGIRQ